jgi:hypothetical protein
MKKNMGNIDRAARVLIALVILGLFMTDLISGTLAIVLLILAGVFILTGLIGTCPLYLPFGFSTAKKNNSR